MLHNKLNRSILANFNVKSIHVYMCKTGHWASHLNILDKLKLNRGTDLEIR